VFRTIDKICFEGETDDDMTLGKPVIHMCGLPEAGALKFSEVLR